MFGDVLDSQDLSLGAKDPNAKQTDQENGSTLAALAGGFSKGLVQAGAVVGRPLFGNKTADRVLGFQDTIFKPANLSGIGEFTYSTSTMLGNLAGSALLTGGVGLELPAGLEAGAASVTRYVASDVVGSAAAKGGATAAIKNTIGRASNIANQAKLPVAYGATTASAKKSELTNLGFDDGVAWKAAIGTGIVEGASAALPTFGFVRGKVADAILSTGLSVGTGSVGDVIQGDYLEGKADTKKQKEYAKNLKDEAFSASNVGTNSALSLLMWGIGVHGKVKTDQDAEDLNAITDAAQADLNMDQAESLSHVDLDTPEARAAHFANLDDALMKAKSDEPINNMRPVEGKVKSEQIDMPMAKLNNLQANIASRAKNEFGFSDSQLPFVLGTVDFESGFNPSAFNKSSKAHGLFQVLDSTWATRKGGNRQDVNEQIRIGLKNMKADIDYVQGKIGRELQGAEVYLPQLLGGGGATTFLKASPSEDFFSVAKRMYSGSKNPEGVARSMMKSNGIRKGMTVADVKRKFMSHVEDRSKKFGGKIDSDYKAIDNSKVYGEESKFAEYESDVAAIPSYNSISDYKYDVSPETLIKSDDPDYLEMVNDELNGLDSPITQQDIDFATSGNKYVPVGSNAVSIESRPTFDLQSRTQETGQAIEYPDVNDLPVVRQAESDVQDVEVNNAIETPQEQSINLDEWQPTASENYVRQSVTNGSDTIQSIHNKQSNTTFSRVVDQDGNVKSQSIKQNGVERNIDSPEYTAVQEKAAKAIEAEFNRPTSSRLNVEDAPNLNKTDASKTFFEQTPEGRQALDYADNQPDFEVTYTPVDILGNELEPVVIKSSEMREFLEQFERDALDDVEAMKVLASCSIKFGGVE